MTSDDRVLMGSWGSDLGVLHALRLHKTREAYENRDLVTALVEAEEILDEDPTETSALEVLGDIELDLGHGREATLVYERLLALHADTPEYLAGLAVARFLSADLEGAVEAGKRALVLKDSLAQAHAYVGLSLEHLGRLRDAAPHLAAAARMNPQLYPPPVHPGRVRWKQVLSRAMAKIPEDLRFFFRKVPIVWHHLPDPTLLRTTDPPVSPLVLALYEGTPPEEGDRTAILPRSMRIYKGNICRIAHDEDLLVEDLAAALVAEASDWTGIYPPSEGEE